MQLSPPDPEKNTARSSGTGLRSNVVASYVNFLVHADRKESAIRLLDRELRDVPLEGAYAQRIVNMLVSGGNSMLLAVDQERLWAYLAARPQWSHQEERLLWRLVEQRVEQP